jgi:hypothetical protein
MYEYELRFDDYKAFVKRCIPVVTVRARLKFSQDGQIQHHSANEKYLIPKLRTILVLLPEAECPTPTPGFRKMAFLFRLFDRDVRCDEP